MRSAKRAGYARMPMAFEVCLINEACAFGWLDRLQIAVYREGNLYEARVFYREMKAGIARFGSGIGHLAVADPQVSLPPPEVRKTAIRVFEEHPTAVSAVAVAFEGQGFFASAVRSAVTGLMLLAKPRIPIRPCGSVADAVAFLSRYVTVSGAPLEPRLCIDAVEELRRRMGRQGAPSA
ncbi:hypothetical protein WMF31_02070 [Sorangium sp. So ce1036]|uniref:hypothetical protein n=1 Tax=Sorangium sp. So ce1036 TaxID=3133328 RepID=UPI003F0FFC39